MAGLEEMCRRLVETKRQVDEDHAECTTADYSYDQEAYRILARDIEEIARFLKMEPGNA